MKKNTYYPSYDVMSSQDEWDAHTQAIVKARFVQENDFHFLTNIETEILRAWCSQLLGDNRGEIIQYVLCHIDESLASSKGEGQRKAGVPPAKILIREGLKAIHEASRLADSKSFFHLDENTQLQMMRSISEGTLPESEAWSGIPQKAFFQKLLTLAVEAYYSHPTIWSEIGYGGPAYPRGYVRADIGQLDPWEAVKEP